MFANMNLLDDVELTADYIAKLMAHVVHVSGKAIPGEYYGQDTVSDIIALLPPKMGTNQLLYFVADYFANRIKDHYYYDDLSAAFAVFRLHLETPASFSEMIDILIAYKDFNLVAIKLLNDDFIKVAKLYAAEIDAHINHSLDYTLDYFSIRTLERSYLTRSYEKSKIKFYKNDRDGYIIERPQYMFMRVALAIWGNLPFIGDFGGSPFIGDFGGSPLKKVFETYDYMSNKYFTHATPTLFNSGTTTQQMSSCFLMHISDSIDGIFKTVTDVAKTIKWAGGIGINISEIRAKGSLIRGTNGMSNGIVQLSCLMNQVGRYIDQGGKRNGSIAVYLEPWHADIFEFLELRLPNGDEKLRARDLFLALWIPDLFMKRVQEDGVWSLMCPDECPGLVDSYGDKFEALYLQYESEGRARRQVNAYDLWKKILTSQIETGMPYMSYKDHANRKSNQHNLGVIRSSNLCNEIYQYSDADNAAVCNLASICLPKFIESDESGKLGINYAKLVEVTRVITSNINRIIDINFYPTKEAKHSNMKNRPMGIGVQGLADVYNIMGLPFGSDEAAELNKHIFETIYYGAVTQTIELAKQFGRPYDNFEGSPFSRGQLQFDLWGVLPKYYDWGPVKADLIKYGARNSLLTAVMPTASTSQIMSNSEAIEPYMSNLFVRSTLAGEFIVINKNMMRCLISRGLWNDEMKRKIILSNGSIQTIPNIPQDLKDIYKTAYEIRQKDIIQQSLDRAPFIDQSQSLNLFLESPNFAKLTSFHMFGWAGGIKTGMYYLRTQPASTPINFGIDATEEQKICKRRPKGAAPDAECEACSS